MRLEEYEAKHLINYKHDDLDSMRQAMVSFIELLKAGEAFEDDYCVAHFEIEDAGIERSYFEPYPALQAYLKEMAYYNTMDSDYTFKERLTGEELFFLCAVIHPELEEDLLKLCEAIVAYANKASHSWELWITCETAFGIGPLQIMAMQYPKYGYLMAQFLISSWDEEHMPYHLAALYQWVSHVGMTDDSIKAYCYCNNAMARQQMLGYDMVESLFLNDNPQVEKTFDLLSYFKISPDNYQKFVRILAEACQKSQGVNTMSPIFDEDDLIDDVLKTIVAELLIQHHPETVYDYDDLSFDMFEDLNFMESSAKEAVVKLRADIEAVLGGEIPLSFPDQDQEEIDSDMDESDDDDDEEDEGENILQTGTLEEKLFYLLLQLDKEDYFRSDEWAHLNQFYTLVDDNRKDAENLMMNWYSDDQMEASKGYHMGIKNKVSHRTYVLSGVYILYRDALKGQFDTITDLSKKCSEKHLSECVLNALCQDGSWSTRYAYNDIKDEEPTNGYRINYKKETVDSHQLWLPVETYLMTGMFKHYLGQEAFVQVRDYYKNNLNTTYRNIGMYQENYDITYHLSHIFKIMYYGTALEGTSCYGFCKRGLRLMLAAMPVYGVGEIALVEPDLKSVDNLDLQLSKLQVLMGLGLPEEGYWAYQFEFWHEVYEGKGLDEGYAMALLDRLFQGHDMMEKSIHYAARSKVTELMIKGVDAMEMTDNAQLILNNFGVDYVLRCIRENFYVLTQYIDNLLKSNKDNVKTVAFDTGDDDKASLMVGLEGYGAQIVDEGTFNTLKAYYNENWTLRSCYLNKTEAGYSDVYNKSILDYAYTCLKKSVYSELNTVEIIVIDNWAPAYVDAIQRLSTVDYKQFWLSCFGQMFTGDLSPEQVKNLLKDAVIHYNFYGVVDFFDVHIENLLKYISSPIKERIEFVLKTVGAMR
jgi:hypothetical protein